MSKLVKKVKKVADDVGKGISTGARSIGRKYDSEFLQPLRSFTVDTTENILQPIETLGKKIHKPFKAPDQLPMPGLSQSNTAEAAPDVDIAATEGSRRRSGSAVGTRKLRVPLGGLR